MRSLSLPCEYSGSLAFLNWVAQVLRPSAEWTWTSVHTDLFHGQSTWTKAKGYKNASDKQILLLCAENLKQDIQCGQGFSVGVPVDHLTEEQQCF